MDLIEKYGSYDAAKAKQQELSKMAADPRLLFVGNIIKEIGEIEIGLLDYRRQHNIFEVGDKVVSINSAFIEYQGVLNIDFIAKFDLMLSDDSKGFEVNAICGWGEIIRHANDAEIKAGHILRQGE